MESIESEPARRSYRVFIISEKEKRPMCMKQKLGEAEARDFLSRDLFRCIGVALPAVGPSVGRANPRELWRQDFLLDAERASRFFFGSCLLSEEHLTHRMMIDRILPWIRFSGRKCKFSEQMYWRQEKTVNRRSRPERKHLIPRPIEVLNRCSLLVRERAVF